MAPSTLSVVAGTAFFVAKALATKKSYQEVENWGANNFFDKFDFFESKISARPNRYDIDPTGGFVNYRNADDASSLGLWKYDDEGLPYIGVDWSHDYDSDDVFGRSSVRLESKVSFGKGLFVFDVAHMPKAIDGGWPAIWTYGDWVDSYDNWPKHGDIDIYEGWNTLDFNRQTLHTSDGCWIKNDDDNSNMLNTMDSYSCNYQEDSVVEGLRQYTYQGCSSHEAPGSFGNADGGVYVLEWTDDHIKLWSFRQDSVPQDITDGTPDPSNWGTPNFNSISTHGSCDIDTFYANQKIVINLDFCGTAGDLNSYWPLTKTYTDKHLTCPEYVANYGADFEEFYFSMNSIKIYEAVSSSTSSSSSSSSSSASSSASVTSTSSSTSLTSSASSTTVSTSSSSSSVASSSVSETISTSSSTISSSSTSSAIISASSSSSSVVPTSATITDSSSSSSISSVSESMTVTSSAPIGASASSSSNSPIASPTSPLLDASVAVSAAGSVTSASYSAGTASSAAYEDEDSCDNEDEEVSSYPTAIDTGYPSALPSGYPSAHPSVVSSTTPSVYPSGYPSGSPSSAPPGQSSAYVYGNSSATLAAYTTSTIYSTRVYTVTSCAATVTDCPARMGQVTTEVVSVATTVCPVTEDEPTKTTQPAFTSYPAGYTTSTVYSTHVYTITSCAATVTNCPVGSKTTEVHASVTVYPINETPAVATTTGAPKSFAFGSGSGYPHGASSNSGSATPASGSVVDSAAKSSSISSSSSSSSSPSSGVVYYSQGNSTKIAGTGSSYIMIPTTAIVVPVASKAANATTLSTSSSYVVTSVIPTTKASTPVVPTSGTASMDAGLVGVFVAVVSMAWAALLM